MSLCPAFAPEPSLFAGTARSACRASVILPARNEEDSLPATLDALRKQTDEDGRSLAPESFEVLLLLNNCTDDSVRVAEQWRKDHPQVQLHIAELTLPAEKAHVGTARRLLMDAAWHRLSCSSHAVTGILSTDSDTLVDAHWISRTLSALALGADAVGGAIRLRAGEFESLPYGARLGYRMDRRYQRLVAELEDLFDPQRGDPWPRHLEHFGASLACTPQAYARAGGMPPVKPLEDVAFVDALHRSGARLRHDPSVIVYTSARLDGRAEIGLSHQLRVWQEMYDERRTHYVPAAGWLVHRYTVLHTLRDFYEHGDGSRLTPCSEEWLVRIGEARRAAESLPDFLTRLDCNRLIEDTLGNCFAGPKDLAITQVNREIAQIIRRERRRRCEQTGLPSIAS